MLYLVNLLFPWKAGVSKSHAGDFGRRLLLVGLGFQVALLAAPAATAMRKSLPDSNLHWASLGPDAMEVADQVNSGRVAALAVDPQFADHWLVGAAQGGIWETWDAGLNWRPKTDDQPSLAMGAIAFAPSDPTIIYAGTGEGHFCGTCYAGAGLLKSINRGGSWFVIARAGFDRTAFSEIRVHPSNPNILMAATVHGIVGRVQRGRDFPTVAPPRGIFKSTDGGSNWRRTLTGEATDIEINTNQFLQQYAALGEPRGDAVNGLYRSLDGGESWLRIDGPWMRAFSPSDLGRIEIAIAPSSSSTVYVSIGADVDNAAALTNASVWRTGNAWDAPGAIAWTRLHPPDRGPGLPSTWWYNSHLLVHPSNPDVLYFAAHNLYRYSAGVWSELFPGRHEDQHALAWAIDNQGARLLVGNDGGVWVSSYGVNTWHSVNRGLRITQFHGGAVHPSAGNLALGGTQDNGIVIYSGNHTWRRISAIEGGSDVLGAAISTVHPDRHWAYIKVSQYSTTEIYRTKDAGESNTFEGGGITPIFLPRFDKHPTLDDHFIVGTVNLWRSDDFFSETSPSWRSNSPVLRRADGEPAQITALAFAPSDSFGQTYAYGTQDGQLRITSDGGDHWFDLDTDDFIPNRYVSDLAFNPTNAQRLYVSLSGLNEETLGRPGHVFQTSNALRVPVRDWVDVSPPENLPALTVAIDPTTPGRIFVGTDRGVWENDEDGAADAWWHWGPESGMPNVAVFDVQINTLGRVTAFTHGRGAFVLATNIPEVIAYPCAELTLAECFRWINPFDLVTLEFPLKAVLTKDTVNLNARLRATETIQPLTDSQLYGRLLVDGSAISKPFSFFARPPKSTAAESAGTNQCGEIVEVILDLEDAGQALGSAVFHFRLGHPSYALLEDLEQLTPPALPLSWNAELVGAGMPWATTTNEPPNTIRAEEPLDNPDLDTEPPGPVFFAGAPAQESENSLYSPVIPIKSQIAELSFRHSFDFEPGKDGGILELSIGGGPFQELEAASGTFLEDGYSGAINSNTRLVGKRAWTGNSGGYLVTRVQLPASASGQSIQLRWSGVTDSVAGANGWYINDIQVLDIECLPPVSGPVLLRASRQGNQLTVSFETVAERTYILEYKAALSNPHWETAEVLIGDGVEQTRTIGLFPFNELFYRLRVD